MLVEQQRVRGCLGHVLHQEWLARLSDLPRDAMSNRDTRPFDNEWREAARRREEQVAWLWRDQHERAALRLHVVADECEQTIHELTRIRDGCVESEHSLDQVQRPRSLTQRLAP